MSQQKIDNFTMTSHRGQYQWCSVVGISLFQNISAGNLQNYFDSWQRAWQHAMILEVCKL